MKKTVLFIVFVLSGMFVSAQSNAIWSLSNESRVKTENRVTRINYPTEYKVFHLNFEAFRNQLASAPLVDGFTGISPVVVTFPTVNGALERYRVLENPVFAPELQAQYPEIRSYVAQGIETPSNTIYFSVSPQKGVSGMILSGKTGTTIIDPLSTNNDFYLVFNKANSSKGDSVFNCSTEEAGVVFGQRLMEDNSIFNADDSTKRTFKLALSVTGEYTAFHGGTVAGANAAINATMTRVNGVFLNDFNLNMVLVANNNVVIYTNGATDPYTTINNWNNQLQATLNANIGLANYDIGHLFGATGGGGNAGCIGCVCLADKGRGITSPADGVPQGDTFDIDYVAHEMGHQFGATHTFSTGIEGSGTNVEPGSGSTIMGYAGITNANVQNNSDAYFHAISIQQITANIKTKTCPTTAVIANAVPTADAGANRIIPIGTAFYLTGVGTDANPGDALTYCWEQLNNATTTATTVPNPTSTSGAMFRSFIPTTTPTRFFPDFTSVVQNGVQGATWEKVPTVSRNLFFRLTVRDNRPGGANNESDDVVVQFDNQIGPFAFTSQNVSGISWATGSSQTVTWSVNNTTVIPGAQNVNIKLSTDGGVTFPITLASNVPNSGSAVVTAPNEANLNCRLLIEPTDATFYAVNSAAFAIGFEVVTTCNTYNGTSLPIITSGGFPANQIGTVSVPMTGEISSVAVFNNLTHTYLSDVVTDISSPQNPGNFIKALNRSCGNTNGTLNLKIAAGGGAVNCAAGNTLQTILPGDSFSVFEGQNPQGTWTLRVYDVFTGDNGTLNSWGIEICTQEVTLSNETFGFDAFKVYPNPSNGTFTVQFDAASSNNISVSVYDMRGRSIYENQYQGGAAFNQEIQLNNAQAGVYLLNVTDGNRKEVKRIVVQ